MAGISFRYVLGGLARDKALTMALLVLLTLSAFFMGTGAMVLERVTASVGALSEQARPSHFLQMHTGDYDPAGIAEFADQRPEVAQWQIEDMVGVGGASISWSGGDMSDSLIDNLFVTQNTSFDLLLDARGEAVEPAPGQVYLPVVYQQRYELDTGDMLQISLGDQDLELQVAGVVRDAQMASAMSSAIRFLVAEEDFATLADAGGHREIIAEFRLHDPGSAGQLQRAYESEPGLPQNGQAVTHQLIRLLNVFSDGLVAAALVLASLLLIAVALLSLRFVIRADLEDDIHEIGALRAIGIPARDISILYLARYGLLALAGCVLGGLLAIPATEALTRQVELNHAAAGVSSATLLVPLLTLLLVMVIALALCAVVLRKVSGIEVVAALIHGSTLSPRASAKAAKTRSARAWRTSLENSRLPLPAALALIDLRAEARTWVLLPLVAAALTILLVIPVTMGSTLNNPKFTSYFGSPDTDVRIDLQFTEEPGPTAVGLLEELRADDRVADIDLYSTEVREVYSAATGREENIRVEIGDHRRNPIEFTVGGPPGDGEIALSVLNAERLGVDPGEQLDTLSGGPVTVSGLYQDVTAGGLTAKIQGEPMPDASGYIMYLSASPNIDPVPLAADYDAAAPGVKAMPMSEYIDQTMGYVKNAFQQVAVLSVTFALAVAGLITLLFLRLRLSRDQRRIGALAAMGFSAGELTAQYLARTLLTAGVGVALAAALIALVGEGLVGSALAASGLGITRLTFLANPAITYLVLPLLVLLAMGAGAVLACLRLRSPDKATWLVH